MQVSDHLVVRPVTVIRILGGILGGLISIPYLIGIMYFLFNPTKAIENPWGVLMALAFSVPGSWLTYRWVTICGIVNMEKVVLRGWLKSITLSSTEFSHFREITIFDAADRAARNKLVVVTRSGQELGVVPTTLGFCRGFKSFLDSVPGFAERSRASDRTSAQPKSDCDSN